MKGLFYKETRCLWQYGKSYILMVVVFFGLSMVNDGGGINTMWLLYPVFLLASLPASLLNADEKDGWMMYCDTLPVTRRQIVTVKYVICAILAAAVTLLAIAAALVRGQLDPAFRAELKTLLPLMPLTGLTAPALMFPAMFRLGAIKGRTVYISVVILVAAACAVLVIADGASARAVPFALSLVISLAVFVGSWALSVKWFRAREL
mgnify:FL=1